MSQPPMKKFKSMQESDDEPLTPEDVSKSYNKFYEDAEKKFKLKLDENLKRAHNELIKSIKNQELNSEKLLVAFFGAPGLRKSSTINFLLCGDKSLPLPTSDESNQSSTKTPIRCRIVPENNFSITTENSNGEILNRHVVKSLSDLNKELKSLMNVECEEIILEISESVLPESQNFLKNVEFLDLIGLPIAENKQDFNENIAIRKNRYSINKQQVDAVFLFGNRQQLVPDMIKYMWLIDIFNIVNDRIPKLVMLRKEEFVENSDRVDGWLRAFQDGTCKKQIERTICLAFDFSVCNEEELSMEDKLKLEKLPELNLKNKSKIIPKLCERSDAVCLISDKKELMGVSKDKFRSVLNDMKKFKHNYLTIENSRKTTDILSDLRTKILNKVRSSRRSAANERSDCLIYEPLRKYLYKNQTYRKETTRTIRELTEYLTSVQYDDFKTDIYCTKDYGLVQEKNLRKIAEHAFDRILIDCAGICYGNVIRIKTEILKIINNKKLNIDLYIDDYLCIDSDFNADYFYSELIKNIHDNDNDYLLKFMEFVKAAITDSVNDAECDKKFNSFYAAFTKTIFRLVDEIKNNVLKNELEVYIDGLYQFSLCIKNFSNKLTEKIGSVDVSVTNGNNLDDITEPLEPKLFTSPGSLKFPSEIGNFTLNECIAKRWMNKNEKKINDALFIDGYAKSQLSLSTRPITDEFIRNLKQFNIDCAIQIHIDRNNKKIDAEYDANILGKRLDTLFKHILESTPTCTALYPIFISSKPRGLNDPGIDFKPNLILPSLHQVDGSNDNKRFMIFLMFEAGTCETRYSKNIEYYLKEVKTSVASEKDFNPIIPIFLPEHELGIGRKRKIMLLLAEHLNLTRFYLIDDDVNEFFQYDERTKIPRTNKYTTLKALDYMSRVLDYSIDCNFDADLDISKIKEKLVQLIMLHVVKLQSVFFELTQLIHSDNLFKNLKTREYFIRLILTHLGSNPADAEEVCKQIKDILNLKSKSIGQIALTNQRNYSQFDSLLQRLQGNRKTTHYVSSVRYQVVLYNLDAIKGIHHVSDQAFFEVPLNRDERINLCRKTKDKPLYDPDAAKAARLGYMFDDKTHVFYQIKNGVSGYTIYYFSFKDQTGQIPSKVDADETESQFDESSYMDCF